MRMQHIALVCLLTGMASATAAVADVRPEEATIGELQSDMAAGRTSSRALVEYFLQRIERLDRSGPALHSIIELNSDALTIAETLDTERSRHHVRGPLHGIPILIKDNIDTADGMLTTAGSLALVDSKPRSDAFIVQRLRTAGAVILGKTNLSEWANMRSSRSSSGWSGRGGQTRNPYDPTRNPCGSSSGSGAAIAAGLAVAAVGTETDGSIVCPSSVNGIVGIKPTVGLVSRSGIIPISASQDTAGAMARTVQDAAVLLSVLSGSDEADAVTAPARKHRLAAYDAPLDAQRLRGARIGVARNLAGFHEGVDVLFEQAISALKAAGATIVDPTDLKLTETTGDDEFTVLLYELKDGLNRYLATRKGGPRTLADLIAFNQREQLREMPYFEQDEFIKSQAKGPLSDAEYIQARARSLSAAGVNGIDAVLKRNHLDAIIGPTTGPAWSIDLVNGDHGLGGEASTAAAIAGYPHVTVPAGYVHGLPVGLSFIGTAWSEPTLIELAYAFEQLTHARHPPTLGADR